MEGVIPPVYWYLKSEMYSVLWDGRLAGNKKTRNVSSRRACPKELKVGGRQKNQ